ncbi:hypothetical protein BH20VER1_BH20VER1_08150 [soil metagenome]
MFRVRLGPKSPLDAGTLANQLLARELPIITQVQI